MGRAAELVGASAERQPLRVHRGQRGPGLQQVTEVRPREDFLKSKSTAQEPAPAGCWRPLLRSPTEPGPTHLPAPGLKQLRRLRGLPAPWASSLSPPDVSFPFTPLMTLATPLTMPKCRCPEDGTICLIPPFPGPSTEPGPRGCSARVRPRGQLLTDTASRCPEKVYKCLQLCASQMRMSLLRSPEACAEEDNGHGHPPGAQTAHPAPGHPCLTRYLPSEEIAMQRTWLLWPGGCPSAPFLARGIT